MRIIRIITRSFKDAFKSIFRNMSLSMASMSCTAITLIIVAVALLATYNVNDITAKIEDVLNIVVFIDKNATDEEIDELKNKLNSLSNVESKETIYNSKDDIRDELSSDASIKQMLETLEENPLQATFVVTVKDVKKLTKTAEEIKTIEHVTKVKYGESLVNKLLRMFDIIRTACIVAVVALIVVTAFLMTNTIKITIFSRRQEIEIMRLVGTSNTVIKLPFLIEGFVLGVIGSIIPILLTIFGYQLLFDYVGGNLFTSLVVLVEPARIVYMTSLVLLIVGGVVGMLGSLMAVRRYLKI